GPLGPPAGAGVRPARLCRTAREPSTCEPPVRARTLEFGDGLGCGVRGEPADGVHRRPGRLTAAWRRGRLVAHHDGWGPNPRPHRHGSRRRCDAHPGNLPPGVRTPRHDRVAVSSTRCHTYSVTRTVVHSVSVATWSLWFR